MADLLTHALLPYLLGSNHLDDDDLFWFVQGGVLPDVVARMPVVVANTAEGLSGLDLPRILSVGSYGLEFLHEPWGFALLVGALALLLPRSFLGRSRRRAFLFLWAGAWTHAAADVIQRHEIPQYAWCYPFSDQGWELGLIGTETSMLGWPLLVPLAWWSHKRRTARVRAPAVGP